MRAVVLILLLEVGASPRTGAILSATIVVAGFCQFVLIALALWRLHASLLIPRVSNSPDTRRFFAQVVPGIVAGGIPQLKLMAGVMVASSSPAAVSWLYYANRLYELPLGVVSIAIASVMVPVIALSVRTGDHEATANAQSRTFEIALGLSLPAAVAFALLADSIAGGLFQRGAFGPRDTAAVAAALAAICAGLPGHTLEKVLGAVSFAREDTRTPMLAALAGLAAAVAGSLALFPSYGHVGVAAAIGISGWVGATLLGVVLWRRGWLRLDHDATRRLPRIIAATMAMGIAIFGMREVLASPFNAGGSQLARIAALALLVVIGLAVYLASLELLGVARMRDLVRAVRYRL